MSYCTDAEAITYFGGTSKSTLWAAIASATRAQLLEDASRYIDTSFVFSGTQINETAAFPRENCYNRCTESYYENNEIPIAVKNATCEIALRMNTDSNIGVSIFDEIDANIKREKIDTLEVEYKDGAKLPITKTGYSYLKCIIVSSYSTSVRFAKG